MAMAVELLSENPGSSPRISFSHDLGLCDVVPVEQRPFRSNSKNSSLDFDFCLPHPSFDHHSSSADELFSDGKILPTQIKDFKKNAPGNASNSNASSSSSSLQSQSPAHNKIIARDETGEHETDQERQGSKSFWRFGRSSSLNCGTGYGRTLCPLPPLLSRSNSTGSAPKEKQKQGSCSRATHQKPPPPLKKMAHGHGSNYSSGVRVTPVLSVPTGNLFGLTSIFFNGRDKNRRK